MRKLLTLLVSCFVLNIISLSAADGIKIMTTDNILYTADGQVTNVNNTYSFQTADGKKVSIRQPKIKWMNTGDQLYYLLPTNKRGKGFQLSLVKMVSKENFVANTLGQLSRTYVYGYDGSVKEVELRYHWVNVDDKNNKETNEIIYKYFRNCPEVKAKMEDNMKKKSEPLFDMDYFTCEGAPTMEEFIAHLDKIYSEN